MFGADASGAWAAQLARVTPVNTRQESVAKRIRSGYVWSASLSGRKRKKLDIEEEAKLEIPERPGQGFSWLRSQDCCRKLGSSGERNQVSLIT